MASRRTKKAAKVARKAGAKRVAAKPTLLAGGNPQIAKADGQGSFLAFHVFTRYVKVTFFRGTSVRPVPGGGTGKGARWIDIHENDLDEAQMTTWIRQAAALPGWGRMST
jgi:hypothetical protein